MTLSLTLLPDDMYEVWNEYRMVERGDCPGIDGVMDILVAYPTIKLIAVRAYLRDYYLDSVKELCNERGIECMAHLMG